MRAHNFGAGPCTLPLDVLEEAREEFLDFAGSGMSILEMSHRSPEYEAVHNEALMLARQVAEAPDDFEVLFVQGGATLQFAMVAINLLQPGEKGAYVVSGSWGKRALEDAKPHGEVYAAWDGDQTGYSTMPENTPEVSPGTRYLHVTSNETIGGIRMVDFPRPGVPLVGDMSSDYLSRPVEWDLFDLVYGGVQKNLAPAGMAVVYVRKQALESARTDLGSYLRYDWHAKSNSLGNTPPMFPIYLMGKVLRRMEAAGGVRATEKRAAEKAGHLYRTIDRSEGFYRNPVGEKFRSHMNVVFRLPEPSLEALFLKEAESRHMIGLKGHRSVGGCRASLYAALPMDSVEALSEFMEEFARSHRAL
ncbi:MAG TPA: 3-phosphoserine/phosphohydroxythreonine transaminase [Acidimicrobiia bacterium]|nr:3-phosphoserine/phosphohydroxythreonine transaminase [Acidimicrobiia bacterium]